MPIVIHSVLAAAVAASLLPAAAAVAGGNPKPPPATPPVKLEITSPAYSAKKPIGVMYESGTAFEIKAAITGPTLGIATDRVSGYIGDRDTGWIVFADPDNCLEIALGIGVPLQFQRPCLAELYPWIDLNETDLSAIVADETYLQFTIERDESGGADGYARNPDLRAALADPLQSGAPEFMAQTREFTLGLNVDPPVPESMPLGPATGGGADDGFGYGADDDLPGLVVLSPRGVGLVYADADGLPGTKTSDFEPVSPRRQWNLAGFLNSVNYELKSNDGVTVLHAGMTLPNGLVAPLIALDNCIGVHDGNGFCDVDEHRFRVDGGPVQTVAGGRSAQDLWTDLVSSQVYEVRAFLVSGVAPAQLEDLNGDGKVTAADATRAGYTVISNESVTRFRQVTGFACTEANLASIFGLDLDGNGQTSVGISCPPGPGALKGIP